MKKTLSALDHMRGIVKQTLEKRLKSLGFRKSSETQTWIHEQAGLLEIDLQWGRWNSRSDKRVYFYLTIFRPEPNRLHLRRQFFVANDDTSQIEHFLEFGSQPAAEHVLGQIGLFELFQSEVRNQPPSFFLTNFPEEDPDADIRYLKERLHNTKIHHRYRWSDVSAFGAELNALADSVENCVNSGASPDAVSQLSKFF